MTGPAPDRDLHFADRAAVAYARHVERRVLALVGSQRALRAIFAAVAPLSQSLPRGMRPEREADGALWFHPAGVPRDAAPILYFHGGGFTIGSPATHAALVGHLAVAAGRPAVSITYRRAPEHPYPAARDDALAAFQRLVAEGRTPVALAGDSAGGCLALQVAQAARDSGGPQPRALALIAPIGDLSDGIADRFAAAEGEILIPAAWPRQILRDYLGDRDPADPAISPLRGDLTGLPPTLIQAGAEEALADDARRLVAAMDSAELDLWPGLPHVWHLHAGRMPAAQRAIGDLAAFINRHAGP